MDVSILGSSIADDVAHDTKNGSIARAREGIKCYPTGILKYADKTKMRENPEIEGAPCVLP